MNSEMAKGFQAGSGVDPGAMKVVLMTIGSGVILVVFVWIVLKLIEAQSDESLKPAEALWGLVSATVTLVFLFSFLALL